MWVGIRLAHGAGSEKESKGWLSDEVTHRAAVVSPVIKLLLCSGHIYSFCVLQHRQLKWGMNMYSVVSPKHEDTAKTKLGHQEGIQFVRKKQHRVRGHGEQIRRLSKGQMLSGIFCHSLKEFLFYCFSSVNPPGDSARRRHFPFLPTVSTFMWGGWASARPGYGDPWWKKRWYKPGSAITPGHIGTPPETSHKVRRSSRLQGTIE